TSRDAPGASNAGAAYLFDATTGTLLRTFTNPTPGANDQFGSEIALFGNRALIAAPFDDAGATDSGAVYLYDTTTGALLRTFTNPTPAMSDTFGTSVALSDTLALVGAAFDNSAATDAGGAYVFDPVTGALLQEIFDPQPLNNDRF